MNKKYISPKNKKIFMILVLAGLALYVIPLGFDSVANKWYHPLKRLFDLNYLLYVFNTSMTNYWYAIIRGCYSLSSVLSSLVATVIVPLLYICSFIFYYKDKGKVAVYLQAVLLLIVIITLITSMFVYRDVPDDTYDRPTFFALILPLEIIATIIVGLRGVKTATNEKPIAAKKVEVINGNTSSADELRKYRELLDSGVISQEEFDAKKKQLLGL